MSNYFDQELLHDLREPLASGQLRVEPQVDAYFDLMKGWFVIRNLRPHWSSLPFAVSEVELDPQQQPHAFSAFFARMAHEYSLAGEAVYVGDSATSLAVLGDVSALLEVPECLFSIPQHHYLLAADQGWFMCFTFEGDMGFGFLSGDLNQISRR